MHKSLPFIPEVVNFTDLRYKTVKLRKKLEEGKEPLLLVNRASEVGVIIPIGMYRQLLARLEGREARSERADRLKLVSEEMDRLAKKTAKYLPKEWDSARVIREMRDERTKDLLSRHQ